MLAAGLTALAGEGEEELGARALARETEHGTLPPARVLHIMHLAHAHGGSGACRDGRGLGTYVPLAALIRVILVTLLVWAVGDLAPRLLAALAPELVPYARMVALRASPIFTPLVRLAARADHRPGTAPATIVRPGAPTPQEMALGVFSLSTMTVSEVMTPRIDIVSVDVSEDEQRVIATLRRSEHARLVVLDRHADAVVGMLHAKDMLPRLHERGAPHPLHGRDSSGRRDSSRGQSASIGSFAIFQRGSVASRHRGGRVRRYRRTGDARRHSRADRR